MRFSIAKAFGINIDPKLEIEGGSDPNHPNIPAIDPNYVFRQDVLSDILAWHKARRDGASEDFLYMSGHTATGKTSIIRQVAARLQIPLFEIGGHTRLEFPEMLTTISLIGGDTVAVDGPLTQAYRQGAWFMLNEANLLDPGETAGFNDIGQSLCIPSTGEQLSPAPGFAFICNGNAVAGGDHASLYLGANRQNLAFLDRFYFVEVDYPEEAVEVGILLNVVKGLHKDVAETMVRIANDIRGLFSPKDGDAPQIDLTCSTRTLIRWARSAVFLAAKPGINPIHYAFDRALGFRAEPVQRTALHEIIDRHVGVPNP